MSSLREFLRDFWLVARPYWFSEDRWPARGLLATLVALALWMVFLNVQFNEWRNDFYNTFQEYDGEGFKYQILKFSVLAAIWIIAAVYQYYLNQMLQLRWRRWLTQRYLSQWVENRAFYALQTFEPQTDNPDQRIADDLRLFVGQSLSLTLGLLSSVVNLVSFLGILWSLSGPLSFALLGHEISIPGYLVWVALGYAVIATWLTHVIGRPLIRINFEQQQREADFRYAAIRFRENSEQIAFSRGEQEERDILARRFVRVINNWWRLMRRQKRLIWFTSAYDQIAVIFPYVVVAPRYFSREIQLGGLMQTASAFDEVRTSLSFIINSYADIAQWKAVIDRLRGFERAVAAAGRRMTAGSGIVHVADAPAGGVALDGVDIDLPDGRPLLQGISADLRVGDRVLLTGASGSGKSTLFRAIGGLWPFGRGTVKGDPSRHMMFLPQKPYLPLGSLRNALFYPGMDHKPGEAAIVEVLGACGLPQLIDRLDEKRAWSQELSPGEQQRIGFARILLQKPDILFLDEATAALDDPTEARMYGMLLERLPDTLIVSIGHRPTLAAFHNRRLDVERVEGGAGRLVERLQPA